MFSVAINSSEANFDAFVEKTRTHVAGDVNREILRLLFHWGSISSDLPLLGIKAQRKPEYMEDMAV